jgi:acyl-CoA synthetase (AMP-forming)/AMP-acid ligase II
MPLPDAPFTGEFATLLDLFDVVAERCGEIEAFVEPADEGPATRITFAQWGRSADGVATRLAAMGVNAGDIVGISLPSTIDYAIAYQAAVRLGAVTSGMNPRLGPAETAHIIERSEPTVIVTDSDSFADSGLAVLSVAELRDATTDAAFTARPSAVDTDPVAIVWTSGTTGKPKGAVFDHACMRAMAAAAGPLSRVGDRRLSPLPFAHVGYMTRVWDELMHVITTVICPTPWTAAGSLALIGAERVTVGQGVPAQWQMMLAHPDLATTDVSSLRIVSCGAARVPPEMVDEMREQFGCPVVVRYTSTEACVSTGTALDDPDDTICNTVGTPGAGVEMELRLDDGRGRSVETLESGDTEVGTVCLRSRAMMRGYWREPELTAAAIDPDGWLLTGDLGHLDARGDLRLDGRSTEMYIRGGYNVYPIEVENCLGQHDGVDRVAVVGAEAPVLGEIGVAFVVPADPTSPPSLADLRTWCNDRLASYKAPDAVVIVDELPLTAMSKIDKRVLAPIAAEAEKQWER